MIRTTLLDVQAARTKPTTKNLAPTAWNVYQICIQKLAMNVTVRARRELTPPIIIISVPIASRVHKPEIIKISGRPSLLLTANMRKRVQAFSLGRIRFPFFSLPPRIQPALNAPTAITRPSARTLRTPVVSKKRLITARGPGSLLYK